METVSVSGQLVPRPNNRLEILYRPIEELTPDPRNPRGPPARITQGGLRA